MRGGLRLLGLAVLIGGGLTLMALYIAETVDASSPILGDWTQSGDIRRGAWIAAGALYIIAGLMLAFLRRWAAIAFIAGAVVAAACMAYDMAAFAQVELSRFGAARIRVDIISLVCALGLTALTVPLARHRVLK